MSGVAAIATPLGNRQVMLWRCGSVGQVNVEMRNLDNQTYTPFKDNGSMKGVVKPSTGLASVVHDNTVHTAFSASSTPAPSSVLIGSLASCLWSHHLHRRPGKDRPDCI